MEKIYYKIVYGYNIALIESESEVKDHQALVDVLIDYLELTLNDNLILHFENIKIQILLMKKF
jgi:hypothetical protein